MERWTAVGAMWALSLCISGSSRAQTTDTATASVPAEGGAETSATVPDAAPPASGEPPVSEERASAALERERIVREFPCAKRWFEKNDARCEKHKRPALFMSELDPVDQSNPNFLDPSNRSVFHFVNRVGILRQSIPIGTRADVELDIPDVQIRDSAVGSIELAGSIRLSKRLSLLLSVPIGYEAIVDQPATWMFGNPKIGLSFGDNLRLPKWLRCFANGYDPTNKIGLATALEFYVPMADAVTTTNCGRTFCTPMANLRQFRPEELPLWTGDTVWLRLRAHADAQIAFFRIEAETGITPGLTNDRSRADFVGIWDYRALISFRLLRRMNPNFEVEPKWWHGWEFFGEMASALVWNEPQDRVYPSSPGLERYIRDAFGPGTTFVADNELSQAQPRGTAGIRYHFEPVVVGVWVSADMALTHGIPMIAADITLRWPKHRGIFAPREQMGENG